MNKHHLTIIAAASIIFAGCSSNEAYGPVPSEAQLAWHDMEYYMFCHFGPNTFTGRSWGLGNEDPDVFNPSDLDCEQWIRTAIAAGMKGLIITAKHHDGFCLWPSKFSTHTVAQSAWKDGKGDVLAELRAAADKYDFPIGVYISPWDRNHPSYGTGEYNTIFASTIEEVHSKYGPFFEQWFDGANGGAQIPAYDWPLFNGTVFKQNPNAVIFSDVGPGCRWVGNEKGYVGETNWCLLDTDGFVPGKGSPKRDTLNMGNRHGANWIPAECDVPLTEEWFFDKSHIGTEKTVEQLMDIWFGSVGRGANLILNVAPDTTGRIPARDSIRIVEFKIARDAFFSNKVASVSECRGTTITMKPKEAVRCIEIQEDIRYGQRVKAFVVEAYSDGKWTQIASGTTIGHKRLLPLSKPSASSKIRIRITDSYAEPLIRSACLYGAAI